MKMNPVIFREYDIRGVVDQDYDAEFAYCLGQAYASLHKQKTGKLSPTITIGQDARLSSPKIAEALAEGLKSSGCKVQRLGLVTTPMSYFTTFYYDHVDGSIMVTGSHNPPEYNGFKICIGNSTIYGPDIKKLEDIITSEKFISAEGSVEDLHIQEDYVQRYKEEFKDLKDIPVVLDCGNGTAGSIARKLYEAVGLSPTILFEEPDGTFPNHHPDPTVEENLVDLKNKVAETGAYLGIGFDGDTDRIGVVDENGRTILGDELMILVSRYLLKDHPGAPIIGDVKCSHRLYEDIEAHGGRPIMWKTGHSLVKQKIKDEKSPFGGELSGHIFFNDRNYGYDDALYAGLRIIEIISKSGKKISEILSDLPEAYFTPEIRVDTTEEKKAQIVEAVKQKYLKEFPEERINTIDGIRIQFEDGWALARSSNTQPVIVLRFESTTAEGLKRIQNEVESLVNSYL